MGIELKVPPLPESVSDATLIAWHKKVGDAVRRDEKLVDLETDKVVLEVPAPTNGVIKELRVANGTVVHSGDVLAILEEGAASAKEPPQSTNKGTTKELAKEKSPVSVTPVPSAIKKDARMSPSARRKQLEEQQSKPMPVSAVKINAPVASAKVSPATTPAKKSLIEAQSTTQTMTSTFAARALPFELPTGAGRANSERKEERVPMTRLRARIAERMIEVQQTAAMLTSFNEVDLSVVKSTREKYRETFEKDHGVRLGYMSFFVKAVVDALKKYPVVNASLEASDIVYHHYFDIGVAVSTERGLMVPVLRNADQMDFAEIEKSISDFALRARDGRIKLEELTGGTFTITNGGVFGSLMSTPILNSPQSAILGMHKIQDRVVVIDGEMVVRPMMYIALTYDHRIIDGRDAVLFLVAIKEALEDPTRMLVQI